MPGWSRNRTAPVAPAEEQISGYRDLHRIGHGGFSVVYRARQVGIDRVVALKVLQVEFVDAQIKRRFLREVQLTGRLSGHPNVVTVLDSGLTGAGRPYIAMDLCERGSLRDRLLASGPLPLAEALRVGVKIAGALDAAHREGIVHRDVKPQNILVSRYGEPALADFGTARLVAEIDASARTEALTPFHAAPEVLEGQPPTAASDVYSLGSTLYQLLAGRAAFQRDGDFGIAPLLLRIVSEEPPPLRGVPSAAEAVILRAMHRDQERRYGTAAELLNALRELQGALGLPVAEVPGGAGAGSGAGDGAGAGEASGGALPPAPADAGALGDVPRAADVGVPGDRPRPGESRAAGDWSGPVDAAGSGDGVTPPGGAASAAEAGAADGVAGGSAAANGGAAVGPVPGFPLITATEWEFGEKTGYRTGHPAAAPALPGWQDQGTANGTAERGPRADRIGADLTGANSVGADRIGADRIGADSIGADGGLQYAPDESTDPGEVAAGRDMSTSRRPRTMTFAAVGVLVVIAIAVPLALAGAHDGAPRTTPSPHSTGTAQPTDGLPTASTATAANAPPTGLAARDATPTGLTLTVAGPTVTLRWKLAAGNDYPLIVDEPSTGTPYVTRPAGTTTYTVIGLHPGTEYCFKVGAVTADSTQAVTIQWSNAACAAG